MSTCIEIKKKQQGTEDVAGKLVELLKIEVITKPSNKNLEEKAYAIGEFHVCIGSPFAKKDNLCFAKLHFGRK